MSNQEPIATLKPNIIFSIDEKSECLDAIAEVFEKYMNFAERESTDAFCLEFLPDASNLSCWQFRLHIDSIIWFDRHVWKGKYPWWELDHQSLEAYKIVQEYILETFRKNWKLLTISQKRSKPQSDYRSLRHRLHMFEATRQYQRHYSLLYRFFFPSQGFILDPWFPQNIPIRELSKKAEPFFFYGLCVTHARP